MLVLDLSLTLGNTTMTCVAETLGLGFLICEMKGLKRKLSESVQHYHVYIWKTACTLCSSFPFALSSDIHVPHEGSGVGFFTYCQELGDTEPAAERVCSGNCVTRRYDQSLGSWQGGEVALVIGKSLCLYPGTLPRFP